MASSLGVGESLRRALIPVIDRTAPLCGRLAQAGGVLPLGTFPEAEIDCYLHRLSSRGRYQLSRAEIRELVPKFSQYGLRALLDDYLGPWWSADYAAVWRSPRQSSSGEWHHDNVGHRAKLFVILGNESEQNGTEFVLHTHKTRWRSFTGRLAPPDSGGWFVPQRRGDVLIFDTNVVHRGRYSGSERIILQVEFSSIFKSLLPFGHCGRYFRSRFERRYGAAE